MKRYTKIVTVADFTVFDFNFENNLAKLSSYKPDLGSKKKN